MEKPLENKEKRGTAGAPTSLKISRRLALTKWSNQLDYQPLLTLLSVLCDLKFNPILLLWNCLLHLHR